MSLHVFILSSVPFSNLPKFSIYRSYIFPASCIFRFFSVFVANINEIFYSLFYLSSVQSLSRDPLFMTPWNAARQASLSITNSLSLPKLMSIESVMPSNISSSVVPFSSCPQSFPASGSFPVSQLFTSGGQSIGASSSVLPMNIQD